MRAGSGALAGIVAGLAAAPASAAECRLALALAVDVSRSVSSADYAVQRDGLALALRDPAVRRAFLSGPPVALALYEWGGAEWQEVVLPWGVVSGEADLDEAARILTARPAYDRLQPTALGAALEYGRGLMDTAPDCATQVLDVSGDGRNNTGPPPARVYARTDFGTLNVNALAIGAHERDLPAYFEAEVIRGPGAFVEVAPTTEDFPAAIRRKLIRELTEPVLGATDPFLPARPRL